VAKVARIANLSGGRRFPFFSSTDGIRASEPCKGE
jgi:hypothetical protein